MTSDGLTPDDLWEWAVRHAGPEAGEVTWISVERMDDPVSHGRFMPPGERTIAVPAQDLKRINAHADRPRVVLATDGVRDDAPALLGLMRNHLEYARVYNQHRGTYALSIAIAAALYPVYRDAGKGSAVVYNALPMMQSANAAAAALVTTKLGPQIGRLQDLRFGSLFRTTQDPVPLDDLARQSTVFAALWPNALTQELGGDVARSRHLAQAHPDAPSWWTALAQDETFSALSQASTVFQPTSDEINAFMPASAQAWQPLDGLIQRAVSYGLARLGPTS
jgi:hypothetical protein